MNRFYTEVDMIDDAGGYIIRLDRKRVRTPSRELLRVPTQALAHAIVAEWAVQGNVIDSTAMPLTRYANTVLDRIIPQREHVIEEIARFAESDLLCYRSAFPADLVLRQAETWDPLLQWAEQTYEITLVVRAGLQFIEQPRHTLNVLHRTVAEVNDWQLAGLHSAVNISGSLIIGLALLCDHITLDAAWAAGQLDELYQAERWGEDSLATKTRVARYDDLRAAIHWLALLRLN